MNSLHHILKRQKLYKNKQMRLSWQNQVKNAITDPRKLFLELKLDQNLIDALFPKDEILKNYPLMVPKSFVNRMEKANINDPLLRQVLPVSLEEKIIYGFSEDPLHENKLSSIPGLIHKYQGRVLLLLTSDCSINCRFCFRRFCRTSISEFSKVLAYIESDHSIEEIIFSGGEPLLLENEELQNLINHFAKISHVKRVRIHTRLPILIPDRIDKNLIKVLTCGRLQSIIVIHANHPNELSDEVILKLLLLQKNNILLLNQSVLLKGVNDSSAVLIALSKKLCEARVLPYYLHLLDKVTGAHHFEVDIENAKSIYAEMRAKLPGYLCPKMVRDARYENAKVLV